MAKKGWEDRRKWAEQKASTKGGLAMLKGIARKVLTRHGFVCVTYLNALLPDGSKFVITPNGCCGVYDFDDVGGAKKRKVIVVVTISRQVWIKFVRKGTPAQVSDKVVKEVVEELCLLRGQYGLHGMFERINRRQLRARRLNPRWRAPKEPKAVAKLAEVPPSD